MCANHYRIIGFPVCISDDTRYARNEYIFNFCIVLDEYADASAHVKVVKRVARMLRVLEEEGGFLSGDEIDESEGLGELSKIVSDGESHLEHETAAWSSAGVDDTKEHGRTASEAQAHGRGDDDEDGGADSRGRGKVYALCEMLLEDLNNYCECMIPVDGTTTLSIRLAPTLPPPPAVRAWHVPVPTVRLAQLTDSNWDLTMLALLPFLDGTHTVAAAARKANTRLHLARAAVQDLVYYGCAILLDAFTFGAVYAPTPLITDFVADNTMTSDGAPAEEDDGDEEHTQANRHAAGKRATQQQLSSSQQGECAAFIARPGCSVSRDEVVDLYCSLRPGLALRHWCAEPSRAEVLARVDVRRLIAFGIIGGFLYRVHRYAAFPLRAQPAGTGTLATATRDVSSGTSNGGSGSHGSAATIGGGRELGQREDMLPLAKYLDGLHCLDEMCTELEMGERAIMAKVRGHGEIYLMAR